MLLRRLHVLQLSWKLQEKLAALAAGLSDANKSAALKMLKSIMQRIMKGEVWYCLDNWKNNFKEDDAARIARELAAKMQGKALQMMKAIMQRIMKGELWYLLNNWKENFQSDEAARLARELAAELAGKMQGEALKMLMAIMKRIMKGELWYMLNNWKENFQNLTAADLLGEAEAAKAAAAAEEKQQCKLRWMP